MPFRLNEIWTLMFLTCFTLSLNGQIATMIADINTGPGDSDPMHFIDFNEVLYYSAFDSLDGQALRGITVAGAHSVMNLQSAGISFPEFPFHFQGKIFFSMFHQNNGYELWEFDGSSLQKAIDVSPGVYLNEIKILAVYDSKLIFRAQEQIHGSELWEYNGDSVRMIKDNYPGIQGGFPWTPVAEYRGDLYLTISDSTHGHELYLYNGDSLEMVADLRVGAQSSGPYHLTVYQDELYFSATDTAVGNELWRYNGSTVELVYNFVPDTSSFDISGSPQSISLFDGQLIIVADSPERRRELYRYDGDTMILIRDELPYFNGENPIGLTEFQGSMYFQAGDSIHGPELWRYDGDTIYMVDDLYPGWPGSYPHDFTEFNGFLYFGAREPNFGDELWRFDPVVGIVEKVRPVDVLLYPNPSSDFIFMDRKFEGEVDVQIRELSGKIVKAMVMESQNAVIVSDLVPGMYMLTVRSETDHFSIRFVKQ